MTPYERFQAYVTRQPMDRPLRYATFTEALAKRLQVDLKTDNLNVFFNNNDYPVGVSHTLESQLVEPRPTYDHYYKDIDNLLRIDEIGVGHVSGNFYHFTERISPLRHAESISELEDFYIETYDDCDVEPVAKCVRELHEQGLAACMWVGHIYENAWQIRGYEEFLMDMIDRPKWCEVLLDKLTRRVLNRARIAAQAGVDLFRCGDDIANQNSMMFQVSTWQELLKWRWKKVCQTVREIKPDATIFYHSDGNIHAVVDQLFDIGFNLLNPLQPECLDLDAIAQKYRGQKFFDGSLGTQTLFPFGSPQDVRDCVKKRVEQFGQDLILAPTHILEPEVPTENIVAFFEAVDAIKLSTSVLT